MTRARVQVSWGQQLIVLCGSDCPILCWELPHLVSCSRWRASGSCQHVASCGRKRAWHCLPRACLHVSSSPYHFPSSSSSATRHSNAGVSKRSTRTRSDGDGCAGCVRLWLCGEYGCGVCLWYWITSGWNMVQLYKPVIAIWSRRGYFNKFSALNVLSLPHCHF